MTDEERPQERRGIRRAVTIVFYLLVAALLVWYMAGLDYASLARLRISFPYLGLAILAGVAQRFLLPLTWVWIVRNLGIAVRDYSQYNFVYAKAWLGRYLPGKIAMVAARVYFAEHLGASRSAIAISSVAEIGAQLFVATAVGLAGVASLRGSVAVLAPYLPIVYAMMALLALMLLPPVFNGIVHLILRVFRRPLEGRPRVRATTLGWAVLGFLLVSIATGGMAVCVAAAVETSAFDHALFVWGTYSLAGALGLAFVFTPSGLGAREAVQLPLLALVFSNEAALAIVLLSRLIEIVVDALFYGLSALWARRTR